MTVHVAIELSMLQMGASGGLAPYVKELLTNAFAAPGALRFTVFATPANKDWFPASPSVSIETLEPGTFMQALDARLAELRPDILVRSYPRPERLAFAMERQVFFIPDLQYETYPEFFPDILQRRQTFNETLMHAGGISTLSEYAVATIRAHSWYGGGHIFVPTPALPAAMQEAPIRPASVPDGPFIFYPANAWPHKNHRRLFAALRILRERGFPHHLVLTGSRQGWPRLRRAARGLPVRHLGYVSRAELAWLFQHASALAFVSLYEGFGIPLLEAYKARLPVVAGRHTSLIEVGADAVAWCDVRDADEIARALESVLADPDRRSRLVAAGQARLARYDWTQAAQDFRLGLLGTLIRRPTRVPSEPLVSIVTPSYQHARFLRETIESVLDQDYAPIELIVMDGGSDDGTVEVLQSYGDRIQWRSEPDEGQTHAINKGMALARGQILAYLNSDDVLAPGAVRAAVAAFAADPLLDVSYGRAMWIDEQRHPIGEYPTRPFSRGELARECFLCQPATFWTRRAAEAAGPFDERLHYAMDYDYWLRLSNLGLRFRWLERVQAFSRLHKDAKTVKARDAVFDEIFQTQHARAGNVSTLYLKDYWLHRSRGLPRALRGIWTSRPVLAIGLRAVRFMRRWHDRPARHGREGETLPWMVKPYAEQALTVARYVRRRLRGH